MLIGYISNHHPAACWFLVSSPLDNITLNSNNNKDDQSLYDFQIGTGAASHVILDTEQLMSCTRVALIDTFASLLGSGREVIQVLKCMNDLPGFITF